MSPILVILQARLLFLEELDLDQVFLQGLKVLLNTLFLLQWKIRYVLHREITMENDFVLLILVQGYS